MHRLDPSKLGLNSTFPASLCRNVFCDISSGGSHVSYRPFGPRAISSKLASLHCFLSPLSLSFPSSLNESSLTPPPLLPFLPHSSNTRGGGGNSTSYFGIRLLCSNNHFHTSLFFRRLFHAPPQNPSTPTPTSTSTSLTSKLYKIAIDRPYLTRLSNEIFPFQTLAYTLAHCGS